jgi:RNA polymerase sigma factor (sigma-70 family)
MEGATRDDEYPSLVLINPDREGTLDEHQAAERDAMLKAAHADAIDQAKSPLVREQDRENIAQETVLELMKELNKKPWLWTSPAEFERVRFRITANNIIDLRRYAAGVRVREVEQVEDEDDVFDLVDSLPSPRPSELAYLEWKEFLESLGRALSILAERLREIWCWRYLDELKPRQIVPLAKIKLAGVYSALTKANKALRAPMRLFGYNYPPEPES